MGNGGHGAEGKRLSLVPVGGLEPPGCQPVPPGRMRPEMGEFPGQPIPGDGRQHL